MPDKTSSYSIKISVIIPTYNRAEIVTRAVDSVLKQTVLPFEIIVVDDGSTDHTQKIIEQYGEAVRYIKQENGGASSARNKGISSALGNYIAFLDSDDEWTPDKLQKQIAFLAKENAPVIITDALDTDGENFGESSFKKSICSDKLTKRDQLRDLSECLLEQNFINLSTALINKKCFQRVGKFDETLEVTEDTDLWVRLAVVYKFGTLNEVTVYRYKQTDNLSGNKENEFKGRLKILKKLTGNDDAKETLGKRKIRDQINRINGRLLCYYVVHRNIKGLILFFTGTLPVYLFSIRFYRSFYWDLKDSGFIERKG